MAKKKVFISYDYDTDRGLKATFVGHINHPDCPFSIIDFSLQEHQRDEAWLSEAQRQIDLCDVFIVLLGRNTHNASGVRKEVNIARGLNKNRFQLRPQRKNYSRIRGAGQVIEWKREHLFRRLS